MRKRSGISTLIKLAVLLIVIGLIGFAGYRIQQIRQAGSHSEAVVEVMKNMIPGLGEDTGISTGKGKDPLPALSIDNIDIVGCLEIPALDLMVPVTASGIEEDGFVSVKSGSPVKGKFRLTGNRDDVFRNLAEAKPGDKVSFTDVEGVRYNYRVTTQFHLKNWDEADNDLMVCYDTDSQTQFVLGCSAAE